MAENTTIAGTTTGSDLAADETPIEASNTPSRTDALKRERKLITQFIDTNHAKIAGLSRENEVHAERIVAINRELNEVQVDATDK